MSTPQNLRHFWRFWVSPIFPIRLWAHTFSRYPKFFSDWRQYSKLPGAEPLRFLDSRPFVLDAVSATPFDAHYFYQAVWARERIAKLNAHQHIDIGSEINFVASLSSHLPTVFIDFRPLHAKVSHLTSIAGDILCLPFQTASLKSLSCLHVVEHIGLGRYGDPLNPLGTQQACTELARVLAPGGDLFFSTPVGHRRTSFNGHRTHPPSQIMSYFASLELREFSAVDDHHQMRTNAPIQDFEIAHYACGLFWFHRPS
jgi:SAM-dependent methyltransferase